MRMLHRLTTLLSLLMISLAASAQSPSSASATIDPASLPSTIASGPYKAGHIQGIAVDDAHQYIYYSYTTMLIKTDMQGRVIGSVTGLLGHLGDLDFCAADGRVYGSLEYKNDAIGRGILQMERSSRKLDNAFYIAIFDVDRITREGMDAERDGIMTTVYLPTVLEDYLAEVESAEGRQQHRLGCSGIDGVAFGPRFGKRGGKQLLTVAYGIYSDVKRSDNDYQVLLQYDVSGWSKYEHPLSQDNMHTQGPAKPAAQYFVRTGNTTYGVQNLEYDPTNGYWMMAVYVGKKEHYPNYALFAADGRAKVRRERLQGIPYINKGRIVPLADGGRHHAPTGIRGWDFGVGSTGMATLGDGYYYLSHNFNIEAGQGSTIRLYKFTGQESQPFDQVK